MTKREFYDRLEQSAFIDSLDNCCRIETNLSNLIGEIFNDHEAQLKAKDEEIERLTAKLTLCDDAYSKVANDFESAVMEIERLKEALEVLTVMCELGIKTQDKYSKIIQKMKVLNKARSIVAMLFWEWRKYNSNFKNEENSFIQGRASKTKKLFYKAHKMLKDNQ